MKFYNERAAYFYLLVSIYQYNRFHAYRPPTGWFQPETEPRCEANRDVEVSFWPKMRAV